MFYGGGSAVVNLLFIVTPIVCVYLCWLLVLLFCNHLAGEERESRLRQLNCLPDVRWLLVFYVSLHSAVGWHAV